jgi:hypothetical protein
MSQLPIIRGGKTTRDPIGEYFRSRVIGDMHADTTTRSFELWKKVLNIALLHPDPDHHYILDGLLSPKVEYKYADDQPGVVLWLDCSSQDTSASPFLLDHTITLHTASEASPGISNEVGLYEFTKVAIYRFIDYSNQPDERSQVTDSAEINYLAILMTDIAKEFVSQS